MKGIVPALLLAAASAFAGWSSSGPTGGGVDAVVVSRSDASVIWAGNAAGVFRSTDGGNSWSDVSGPLVDVQYLAVHPSKPETAWAATSLSRVFRTTDGGMTWTESHAGLPSIIPSALLVDPRSPDTLYIGSHCDPARFAALPPRISGNAAGLRPQVYEAGGVFKSTDGGETWKPAYDGLSFFSQCAEELSIDPFSPWRLFSTAIYSEGGQSESYDGARTWERADGPRPARAVLFDPRYPFTHFGITSRLVSDVVVSQDGGFTWKPVGARPPETPTALSIDPERGRLFLGTVRGVFRSGNGGTVWAGTSLPPAAVTALDFGGVPRSLFAATAEALYRVNNRGLGAADPVDLHDRSANVRALAIDPTNAAVLYAGTPRTFAGSSPRAGRLFRSTDGGGSWERADANVVPAADLVTIDGGGTVYTALIGGNDLYRRAHDDAQWSVIHFPAVFPGIISIRGLTADPKTPGTIFMQASGLRRSRDGGATWTDVTPIKATSAIAIDPNDARWIYVANTYELLRSSDGGDTWTDLEPLAGNTRALAIAPSNSSVLYRITSTYFGANFERSDDRAATWRPAPLPNDGRSPVALAVDPRDENSVWVSASLSWAVPSFATALYHSADGGKTWTRVALPFETIAQLLELRFDPGGRVLHAAFANHGVWELTLD